MLQKDEIRADWTSRLTIIQTFCSLVSVLAFDCRHGSTGQNLSTYAWLSILLFNIITLMIIKNRALWLARSFALSRYNHHAVITTLKASSFQNGSHIFLMFRSRKLINTFIFSSNHQFHYTKTIRRLWRREYRRIVTSTSSRFNYSQIFTSPEATTC